jgi:hypothetical protein
MIEQSVQARRSGAAAHPAHRAYAVARSSGKNNKGDQEKKSAVANRGAERYDAPINAGM